MAKVAKMRRFTAPPQALQAIVEQQELSAGGQGQGGQGQSGEMKVHKKRRKKKVKRTKKVICYETKREMVRKKVHKKRRVLRKKKVQFLTIRVTEGFAEAAVPDFPPPRMALSVRRWLKGQDPSSLAVPLVAVQEVELSLLEGFVMPLAECYGDDGKLSFITRSVLQWLMELRADIEAMAAAVEVERVRVPIASALTANLKPADKGRADNERSEEKEEAVDGGSNLDDEAAFYEEELSMLRRFEEGLCGEIEFTERVQRELDDAQFLRAVFDFDLEADPEAVHGAESGDGGGNAAVIDDEEFAERMASEIDGLWSEFAADLHAMGFAQKQFEAELVRREREQAQTARLWVRDSEERQREEEWALAAEDTMTGDRMAFSNFVASNKLNDFTEDDTVHCINYLQGDAMSVIAE